MEQMMENSIQRVRLKKTDIDMIKQLIEYNVVPGGYDNFTVEVSQCNGSEEVDIRISWSLE